MSTKIPRHTISWLKRKFSDLTGRRPVGGIDFGNLRQLTPVSRHFGYDRGTPIDRYYIENFLESHSEDIHGRVLEIGDDSYTTRFGGQHVTTKDILHINDDNPHATFVGDLASASHIPSDSFDCLIFTQTLHYIYDLHSAISNSYRILKPGGTLLATAPGISHISVDEWADYWNWAFTPLSLKRLFSESFSEHKVDVTQYGNVLTSTAFLQGLSHTELTPSELDYIDKCYPLLITVRATKQDNIQTRS